MVIIGAIASDGRQPAAETSYIAQAVKTRKRQEKDVVHQIVDIAQGNPRQQDSMNHPCVAVVEPPEGVAVALASVLDQLRIIPLVLAIGTLVGHSLKIQSTGQPLDSVSGR